MIESSMSRLAKLFTPPVVRLIRPMAANDNLIDAIYMEWDK